MRSAGEIAAAAVGARSAATPIDPRTIPAPPDACGCPKLEGTWGNGGFHFRPYCEADVNREIDRALASLPAGSGDGDRQIVERATKQRYAAYLGLHVAFERCPAFLAACERNIRERGRQAPKAAGLLGADL